MSTTETATPPQSSIDKFDVKLKKAARKLRIKEADKGQTQKGFTQWTFKLELIEEPQHEVDGQLVDVNGLMFTHWMVTTVKSLRFVNEFLTKQVMPPREAITEEEVEHFDAKTLIGSCVYAVCFSEMKPKLDDDKKPIINPHTGKPIMIPNRAIDNNGILSNE